MPAKGSVAASASPALATGLTLAVVGAIAFSAKAIIVKLAYRHGVDAITLIMLRMLFALPFFLAIAWWTSRPRGGVAPVALSRADKLGVLGLGFTGYYLASFLDFAGLAYISASLERLILYLNPTLVLLLGGFIPTFEVPFWVMLACATAITLGVLSGGWRIVRTLGFAIYRVRPVHALGSQLTSAIVIMGASAVGAPVSTTHVVATSIMGIGASERPRAVRWSKARDIATTWVVTIPGSALVSIQAYALVNLFMGVKP